MDINEILSFDLTQFGNFDKKQEDTKTNLYSKEKSMYLSYISYGVLFLSIVGVILVSILGLPKHNAVWWGIPFYIYTIAHIVPFIFVKKNRRALKFAEETKEYNNVALSFFILSLMLSISMTALFIARAISPNFMLGF